MTENKRFTLKESDIYNRNDVIHDNGIEMPQSTVCDLLNSLNEENVKLQARNKYLAMKIQRERNIHVKEHEKWEEEIQKENEQLKTTISRLIEQNRKNNDLLESDIRLLEKALWCPNCARNIKRLKELKKEFEND